MILLVTGTKSRHADLVEAELQSIDCGYCRLNVDRFLRDYKLWWSNSSDGELTNTASGEVLPLGEVRAVWWYDFPEPSVTGLGIDRRFVDWAKYETRNGLLWVLTSLDAWYMSRPEAIDAASLKTTQMRAAAGVGFTVPATLISNDASQIRRFIQDQDPVVFKTIAPLSRERGMKTKAILTTMVREADIDNDAIAVKMNLFQAFIKKEHDIRATVVDDEVFAVRIDSQGSGRTAVDWRRYDVANTPHTQIDLPIKVQHQCVRLTKRLGLNFGAIDFAMSENEELVFLEVNPVGLWLWLEGLTGIPVSRAIATKLVQKSIARCDTE